jgi:hypothetical protein
MPFVPFSIFNFQFFSALFNRFCFPVFKPDDGGISHADEQAVFHDAWYYVECLIQGGWVGYFAEGAINDEIAVICYEGLVFV